MTTDDRSPRRPPPPDVVVLGLDIGGTKLAAGVVTGDGRVLSRAVIPARAEEGPWSMIDRHVELARQVVADADVGWSRIGGIGIACGGPLDPDAGLILSPPNLPSWDRIPLVDAVSERLGLPAAVENDATAGALAEWWFGAGRSRRVDDLIYLTISTGIGGGLVLGGRLYKGVAGNAGELGHLTVIYDGRQCGCGRRGCLEAYASGTNIAARAREAIAAGEPSSLSDLPTITAKEVAQEALARDPLATRIWDETMAMLGSGIANILDIFNPALIVLGGGVTRVGDQLLVPVRDAGLRDAMEPARRSADVVLTELGTNHDVMSAAVVAFERLPMPAYLQEAPA
ncbi:MAG: ROK family protein [Chloroflexota bacterium]